MRLTVSFTAEEFDCHDGTEAPLHLIPNLTDLCVGVLQRVRDKWGPLVVISGYRTDEYNKRIRGAPRSTHVTCEGADIRPVKVSDVRELTQLVETMIAAGELPALGGFGVYRSWIHLDVRRHPDGHLRRWFGTGIGSESGA
jgi:uncharacterized protein YcbK (DUF882 family)